MKKNLRNSKVNRIKKRAVSVATAFTVLVGSIPISEISDTVRKFTDKLFVPIVASAYDKYDVADYTTKDNEGRIRINDWGALQRYSKAYYEASQGTYGEGITHKNDTILIAISEQAGSTFDLSGGFEPIGNDDEPFEGKLLFETGSPDTFNVDVPIFGTVSEKVIIAEKSNEAVPRVITVKRTDDTPGVPLLANKVISDDDASTHSNWNLVFESYDLTTEITYAGVINEIGNGANVELTVANNATQGLADIKSDADVGAVCGNLGDNATLSVNYSGTNRDYSIISTGGHAGGFVGYIGSGSVLSITTGANLQSTADTLIKSENGYAGGIVGFNNAGTLNLTLNNVATYDVQEEIVGNSGAGGIFGKYTAPAGTTTLDISMYYLNSKVNSFSAGSGNVGGLIGELATTSGCDLTISGGQSSTTITSTHGGTTGLTAAYYGGIIGKYSESVVSDSVTVQNVTVAANNELSAVNYGGGIGKNDIGSYVKFDSFTLASAEGNRTGTFGGLVADAEGAYIYAKDVTIGSLVPEVEGGEPSVSSIAGFTGGGLVGKLGDGVLGMAGTIDVSNAQPTVADVNGHLVGSRDNALIYAESGWSYSSSAVKVDNVGSWGDVTVFGSSLAKADVFASETGHIITLNTVDTSDIDSAADYAITSILFQLDPSKNAFLNGTRLADNTALTFTDNIDLTGTGLRGITRDNGDASKVVGTTYKGTATGTAGKTITLDIKNVGGKPVYYHTYLGLFGRTNNAVLDTLTMSGTINVENNKVSSGQIFVGAAAAQASGSFTVSNCSTVAYAESNGTETGLKLNITGGSPVQCGRLLGECAEGIGTVTISGGTFDGIITGTASADNTRFGGVVGYISKPASTAVWSFSDLTIKGTVESTRSSKTDQKIAGLIASMNGDGKATVNLSNIYYDDFTLSGTATTTQGGLLGYIWDSADVNVNNVSLFIDSDSDGVNDLTASTVEAKGAGGAAGLVYQATGHWTVSTVDLTGIIMKAGSAGSVGMIVNKGVNGTNGVYLELPLGYSYSLSFGDDSSVAASVTAKKFDELCAFSSTGASTIMSNGQGIVSVSSSGGLKMEATAEDSLTYKPRTGQGKTENPNTRYYYNLDTIDKDNTVTSSDPQKQLMRWGLNQYAASNIKSFFPDPFTSNGVTNITSADYDMTGYSWYPVTPNNAVTVAGTFKFYNKEYEGCETASGSAANGIAWSSLSGTQHYMMQNGLFYNINNNLTIGTINLRGTVGAKDTLGTGALVYGTVSGSSPATKDITEVDSTSGTINLDGVMIWNYQNVSSDYAPLLINKTGSFVNLKISNVFTTSTYAAGAEAATSLIGYAGTADTDTYVSVNFSKIKLDARKNTTPALSAHGYNTTKSIFTRATLLERLVGESGIYNYSYDDDWGTGGHKVTYGEEVGYSSTNTATQYPGQEQWYARSATNEAQKATQYSSAPSGDTPSDTFGYFLPYVKIVSPASAISAGTEKYYQLKVNHQPTEVIQGCGTYNDPYVIKTEDELVKISKWIAGTDLNSATINAEFTDTWCNGKTEHKTYSGSTGSFVSSDSSDTKSNDEIRHYLASAYYSIEPMEGTSITINAASTNFKGLGTNVDGFHFRGVIIGNGKTIVNKTPYPLIAYSEGSVVKNLTITVDTSDLYINKNNNYKGYIYINGMIGVFTNWNNTSDYPKNSYGSVIATIVGGDNIIDNVQVNLSSAKFYLNGSYAQYTAIGGYVGVIIDGGLVFRNMSGSISGLTDNTKITNNQSKTTTTMIDSDNNVWMFVNPIIGRVINGFAVTESSTGYKPREADVTMKNSTGDHTVVKNYSIADIATSGSTLTVNTVNYTIGVPDSQAFYVMSLIVNSGMGANLLGYSATSGTNYFMRRHAAYSAVGSTASSSTACDDYDDYASLDSLSSTPYLIYKYAGGSAPIGTDSWTVNLTTNGNYDLPDGFRGIGNFFNNNDSLRLNISTFNGNGSTINQNTKYYYYNTDCNTAYLPNNGDEYSGLGLINCQVVTCNYSNVILTGSVKCDAIKISDGESMDYVANKSGENLTNATNRNGHLSAAMLLATVKSSVNTLDSVALQNVNVKGVRYTGGLIGNLPKSTTTLTNTETLSSYGITVHGAGTVGGMIGRSQEGSVTIDNDNATYSIVEVVSDCTSRGSGADYNFGVGGFIGICRGSGASYNINISNVIVGTKKQDYLTEVKCPNAEINTGGMIGILNNAKANLSNCKIYNQSVSSQYTAGGLIGYVATLKNKQSIADTYITGVTIECKDELNCEIKSTNKFAGGFIGACKYDSSNIKITDGKVKGYTISGPDYVGGIVGLWSHTTKDGVDHCKKNTSIITNNVTVENSILSGTSDNSYVGGMIGYLNVNFSVQDYSIDYYNRDYYGYNILENNVKVRGANKGCVCGGTNNTTYNVIKLVGFSRQETLEEGETSEMAQDLVGSGGVGTGGYVIFADNQGLVSNETNTASVDIATGKQDVGFVSPFVTVNPKTNLDASKFLTGDGANTAAINAIYKAIEDQAPGYYSIASSVAASTKLKYSSSFESEMGTKNFETGKDFPVLIVDDINAVNTTALINNYIALLTNTTPYNSTTGEGYNYASTTDNGVSKTVIHKCTFNEAGTELTIKAGQTGAIDRTSLSTAGNAVPCLKRSGTQFSMVAKDTDTAAETAQFTLLDIQYFDPSTVTWGGSTPNVTNAKIAYHLYIPVYIRKVLEYDFDIHVESGTSYKINPASSLVENTLIENIGVPITFEFAFTYKRTADEWLRAANSGDSLLSNYPKTLLFDNSTKENNGVRPYLPSTTKMVLIDTQNNSKVYYLDSYSGSSSVSTLNLSDFSNGGAFSPINFNDMMIVTVRQDNNGTLVKTSEHPGTATLVDNSTSTPVEYRAIAEDETGIPDSDKYIVDSIILGKDAEHPEAKIEEHYFLTIYTKYLSNDTVYHYSIGAAKNMGTDPYPSRITTASENNAANLFLGDIYDQTVFIDKLSVGDSETLYCIDTENNELNADLRSTVSITTGAENNGILTYLGSTNPPTIFESLSVQFDKYNGSDSDIGIKGVNNVDVTSYKINDEPVTKYNATWNKVSDTTTNSTYIEMRNNVPLASLLVDGTVKIEASVTVSFDTENGGISAQFYPETPTSNGTKVIALSKMSSNRSTTAYSKVLDKTDELSPLSSAPGTTNRYYTNDSETAELTYEALEIYNEGQLPQLGINANDEDDVKKLPAEIRTNGSYDVEKCQTAWASAEKVRCKIELKTIDDNYSTNKKIFDYIDEDSFSIFNGTSADDDGTTDYVLIYTYNKSDISAYYQDKIYQIPINFNVLSGSVFESANLKYANYGIYLTVSLVDNQDNAVLSRTDYVKFTNARIYIEEKVTP